MTKPSLVRSHCQNRRAAHLLDDECEGSFKAAAFQRLTGGRE